MPRKTGMVPFITHLYVTTIEQVRIERGMTTTEAALAAGWPDRRYWSEVTSGRRVSPSLDTIAVMAQAVGLRLELVRVTERGRRDGR